MRNLGAIVLVCLGFCAYAQVPSARNKFIVIAHRGDHTQSPENTLKAYEDAVNAGVDYVEIDLRTTKDGKLIIMHDETVDHMTNGKGHVNELLLSDIQQLRVSDKKRPELGAYPIPSFSEVLEYCKGKVNIYIDFKDASVVSALKEIREAGVEKSIVVYINSEKQYSQWRALASHIPLIVSLPETIGTKNSMLDFLKSTDAEILDGRYNDYTFEKTEAVHQMNRKIWADIQHPQENPEMWEKALLLKLDGLQTDHPAELIEFLLKKGLR